MITVDSLLAELEASGYQAPRPEGPEVVRAWNDGKLNEVMMLGLIALMLRKLRDTHEEMLLHAAELATQTERM